MEAPLETAPKVRRFRFTSAAVGLFSGAMSALLGVGAGLFLVPAMGPFLRLRNQQAAATSLAVVIPVSLVAAFRYHQNLVLCGQPGLDLSAILWLAVGSVVGGVIGALASAGLGLRNRKRVLGVPVILLGIAMLAVRHALLGSPAAMSLGMLGLGVGTLGGVLGLGGGLVMVPALVLLLGWDQKLAQGVSLAVIVPVSLFGTLIHIANRRVRWDFAGWLMLGAVSAAWVVSGLVGGLENGIPSGVLRGLFAALMIWEGGRMVLGDRDAPIPPATDEQGDKVVGSG